MRKKILKPGEKVGLKLTQDQRSLLLDALLLIPQEVVRAIRSTPVVDPLMFTLDELEDLAGHVAASANHAQNGSSQGKLDRISRKIDKLLGSSTDQPRPTPDEEAPSSVIETLLDMFAGAEPHITPIPTRSKRGEVLYPVPLTEKQREALIGATRLRRAIRTKLAEVGSGTQVVGLTRKELDETASEVAVAVEYAPPLFKKRLQAVLGKLAAILDAPTDDEPIPPSRKRVDREGRVYQLKITLKDVKPPVWRRVLVADCTLGELHEVIQVVMGWHNGHLYDFEVAGRRYTDPRGSNGVEREDATEVRLSQVASKEKAKLRYTYDFGDHWRHEVLIEKVLPNEAVEAYPACTDGRRACPPEDVGGPWGYEEYLAALADPRHEQHEEMTEWRGPFDPEAFDAVKTTQQLRRRK